MKRHALTAITLVASILGGQIPSTPAYAETNVCAEARKKFVIEYRTKNHSDELETAYKRWRARAWHAAVIASRRWNLIQKAVMNHPAGPKAQEAYAQWMQRAATPGHTYGELNTLEERGAKLVREAFDSYKFPPIAECPEKSSVDERFRDPPSFLTETAKESMSKGEVHQYERRFKASYVELADDQPILQLNEQGIHEAAGSRSTDVRVGQPVSWCKVDYSDGDIRFPLTWSRPYALDNNRWSRFDVVLMAGDARFSPKDANGNVRPPSELAKEGYFVYIHKPNYWLVTGQPLSPNEVLDDMAKPPVTMPSEQEITEGLPEFCKPDPVPQPAPQPAVTDTDKAPDQKKDENKMPALPIMGRSAWPPF